MLSVQCFVLLAVVAFAAAGHHSNEVLNTPTGFACRQLLKFDDKATIKAASEKCITQLNLKAQIDAFKPNDSNKHPEGAAFKAWAAKNPTEALAIRKCVSVALKDATVDGSGNTVFNITGLIADITAKAAGSTYQANILKALSATGCDKTLVTANFRLREYLGCVITYCATGAAPVITTTTTTTSSRSSSTSTTAAPASG